MKLARAKKLLSDFTDNHEDNQLLKKRKDADFTASFEENRGPAKNRTWI